MNSVKPPPAMIVPFHPEGAARAHPSGVLAVVGGALDEAVLHLARTLAHEGRAAIDLLVLVEVPAAFPLVAYGRYLLERGVDDVLERAVERCGDAVGKADILLCRGAGRALAAETAARGSADLVIGAPAGGWWARHRAHAAITYMQRHATCRIFVVHVPPPPEQIVPRAAAR